MQQFYDKVASYIKQEWISSIPQLEYLKKYFENALDYKGKANRPEFWWPALFNFIVGLAFQLLMIIFAKIGFLYQLVNLVSFLYSLLCLIPSVTVGIRRLHDVKQSGWLVLLPVAGLLVGTILTGLGSLIPIIGGLFSFVGAVLPLISIAALFILFALKSC